MIISINIIFCGVFRSKTTNFHVVFFLFHSIASIKTNDVKCKKKKIPIPKRYTNILQFGEPFIAEPQQI